MNWRLILILSLLAMDVGAFFLTAAYLPRTGSFGFSSDFEYFVRSRQHWDIAKTVLVASLFLSAGVYGLVEARVRAMKTSR